uniref:Uncharacterized protein n=1 Tax=Glossina palpalis gambiensis TaxID=67801 RepID=A0A1B0AZ44_9MUSC
MPFLAKADIGVNLMTSSLTGPKPKRPVRSRLCIPPAVTSTTFSTFSTRVGRLRSNLDESSPNPNCPISPCPHTNTRPVTRGLSGNGNWKTTRCILRLVYYFKGSFENNETIAKNKWLRLNK